ncbi:MAG: inositol-3-phosphate synthase [Halobacteriota archaeon]
MKVWFIGIKGAVATTIVVGVLAIKRGLSAANGIMSEEKRFSRLNLARLEDLQFGGHDIRSIALYDAAYQNVSENSTFDTMQLAELKEEIDSIPVKCGIVNNCGDAISSLCDNKGLTLSEAANQASQEIREFAGNERCVVVNLASTEPYFAPQPEYATLDGFEAAVKANSKKIPASAIYAYCAIKNGLPYINFTPSMGNDIPAIKELANSLGVPHC